MNLDEIRDLIAQAQKLNKDDYTAESWDAMQSALTDAAAAANDPEVTQDQIDAMAAALKNAIEALEKAKPGEEPSDKPGQEPGDKPGQTPDGNNGSGSDKDPNGNTGAGAEGEQNNGSAVQTGDNSPIMAYGTLTVIAAAGIICIAGMRKRRR